jgi:hypothetical protein
MKSDKTTKHTIDEKKEENYSCQKNCKELRCGMWREKNHTAATIIWRFCLSLRPSNEYIYESTRYS